jgi:hypothetical protein
MLELTLNDRSGSAAAGVRLGCSARIAACVEKKVVLLTNFVYSWVALTKGSRAVPRCTSASVSKRNCLQPNTVYFVLNQNMSLFCTYGSFCYKLQDCDILERCPFFPTELPVSNIHTMWQQHLLLCVYNTAAQCWTT